MPTAHSAIPILTHIRAKHQVDDKPVAYGLATAHQRAHAEHSRRVATAPPRMLCHERRRSVLSDWDGEDRDENAVAKEGAGESEGKMEEQRGPGNVESNLHGMPSAPHTGPEMGGKGHGNAHESSKEEQRNEQGSDEEVVVRMEDFLGALSRSRPSVSDAEMQKYADIRQRMSA